MHQVAMYTATIICLNYWPANRWWTYSKLLTVVLSLVLSIIVSRSYCYTVCMGF